MRIVVIGGSGLIGKKVVQKLRWEGHDAVPASPSTGVNTLTGEGLANALAGAAVVVDVSNSPSFADDAVMEFFEKSTTNIVQAIRSTGSGSVKHYAALSVVGTDLVPDSGYFRAKLRQESLIRESGIPYTIVRATQFFEFLGAIANLAADGGKKVRVGPVFLQPVAAEEVADAVVRATLSTPANAIIDVAGPKRYRQDELMRLYLAAASQDPQEVVLDPQAGYFGSKVSEQALVPQSENAWLGDQNLESWLTAAAAEATAAV